MTLTMFQVKENIQFKLEQIRLSEPIFSKQKQAISTMKVVFKIPNSVRINR